MIFTKPGFMLTISVPRHRELAAGTLQRVLRDAGPSVDEFIALIN